jgi:peptidoglycan/LPS O-acetylase OafA/YrhL
MRRLTRSVTGSAASDSSVDQPQSRSGYRPDIEGLRGVAVSLVVVYHATSRLHGGFIGVDVFFVLSGYLITDLLVREIEDTGRLSLAGFYARRARRLLPASTLVLVATILACTLFLSPLQQVRLQDSGSRTALYTSNFWFLGHAVDYFAPDITANPFLHTWSLAVESSSISSGRQLFCWACGVAVRAGGCWRLWLCLRPHRLQCVFG